MSRPATLICALVLTASVAAGAVACSDSSDEGGGATPLATEPAATETPSDTTPSATAGDSTPAEGEAVTVNLTEYIVAPKPASVPAGSVTFTAKNIGGTIHELVVIKTDLAAESLPTTAEDGSVDESGTGIAVIGRVPNVAVKSDGSFAATLESGSYVLICNVVERGANASISHYARGMHAAFSVE